MPLMLFNTGISYTAAQGEWKAQVAPFRALRPYFQSANALHRLLLPLEIPCRLLQVEVALLICTTSSESHTDKCRPCPPPEEENREDDTEAEAEGGFNEGVGEAAIPLFMRHVVLVTRSTLLDNCAVEGKECATFSFKSASLTGRATTTLEAGAGGGTVLSDIVDGRDCGCWCVSCAHGPIDKCEICMRLTLGMMMVELGPFG